MATLEIDVSPALARRGFPLPRPDSTHITQEDFPAIIAAIAVDNDAQFGSGADSPQRAGGGAGAVSWRRREAVTPLAVRAKNSNS